MSRDRAVVDLVDIDGTALTGTLDSVGRDYVEVAEHSADLPRRTENVIAVRAVPFAGIAMVSPPLTRRDRGGAARQRREV